MKITSIKQQVKRADRYSIFVEGKYAFSLSEGALVESKIHSGQELTAQQVREFKKLSADDKLYNQALRYAAMRPRSRWEVTFYLERKQASPALVENILNKLSNIQLIDDLTFAKTFISNRQLLRPTSRRKIWLELKQKRVDDKVIEEAMSESATEENVALLAVIEKKCRQSKYQDDNKLMQYLARQGFRYDDIKSALKNSED